MQIKIKKIILLNSYFFILSILLFSCNKAVEINESFSFESDLRPTPDGSFMKNLIRNFNDVSIDIAKRNSQDSVLTFEEENTKDNMPNYRDIVLFTITSTKQLESVVSKSQIDYYTKNKNDLSVSIAAIDFTKNFVLLIGHPKPSNYAVLKGTGTGIYFDKVIDNGLKREYRKIEAKCSRLGDIQADLNSFSQTWKSEIYVLERKLNDSIDIVLDDKSYPFSLKE
jgi:hypothetical protein